MAGLSVTGQMKVSTLQDGFLKEFGLTLRIYDGRSFADPTQTLAQVRKKKGSGKALSVAKNMKVGNLEDKFEEEFGLKVQVAGSDDSYLCDNDLTLNAAQQEDEKKLGRKAKKAARGDDESDGGEEDDDERDELDLVLDEMMDEHENRDEHVFIASINLTQDVYDSEFGEFEFEGTPCPEPILQIIVNEVSEFCECVSLRLDNGDPCYLIVLNSDGKKLNFRINPDFVEEGISARVSEKSRKKTVQNLKGFSCDQIMWADENVMVAIKVAGCDHWDRNFLKVSEAYPGKSFSILGWHEMSDDYAVQAIDDGDFDTGIESDGGDEYLGSEALSRFGLEEKDFEVEKYK